MKAPFLASALKYATVLGWPVFPLIPRTKKPLTEHGFQDASRDIQQIEAWWKKWPQANIGVPTGIDIWALDVDPRHGGNESLETLTAKHGRLPDTIQQITGGGGRQFCFVMPDQQEIGSRNGVLPGIDVKGTGGYIVVPPSIHPDTGKQYVWDGADELQNQPILPAPPWLCQLVTANGDGEHKERFRVPEKIPHGVQHDTLVRLAGSLRRAGLDEEEIFVALWKVNVNRCERPGPEKNIREIARDAGEWPSGAQQPPKPAEPPRVLTCADMLAIKKEPQSMMFNDYPLPSRGLTLKVGPSKGGKTLLAIQEAVAIASGKALFEFYSVAKQGGVLIVEEDDRAGAASIADVLKRCGVSPDLPLYVAERVPYRIGPQLIDWMEEQFTKLSLAMIVLDSYTALRGARQSGSDIVLAERNELTLLNDLAMRLNRAIQLIHHTSVGGAGRDWTLAAAGTFALNQATEALIYVSRFPDWAGPERLVRIRGKHASDLDVAVQLRVERLDYEYLIEGIGAPLYVVAQEMKRTMGTQIFSPKALYQAMGISAATAHRQLSGLCRGGLIKKIEFGKYAFPE